MALTCAQGRGGGWPPAQLWLISCPLVQQHCLGTAHHEVGHASPGEGLSDLL